jgi:hypothetical protein
MDEQHRVALPPCRLTVEKSEIETVMGKELHVNSLS